MVAMIMSSGIQYRLIQLLPAIVATTVLLKGKARFDLETQSEPNNKSAESAVILAHNQC